MVVFIIVVILLAAVGILGAVVEGLLWLTAIAILAVVAAAAYGWSRLKAAGSR